MGSLTSNLVQKKYNMCGIKFSYDFAKKNVPITAMDMAFGIEQDFFDKKEVKYFAFDSFSLFDRTYEDFLISLFWDSESLSTDEICNILKKLSLTNDISKSLIKFFDLLLMWIYQNKSEYVDFWGTIECIYADFGAPKDASSFIRFMPSNHPLDYSNSETRMMQCLQKYIEKRQSYWNRCQWEQKPKR